MDHSDGHRLDCVLHVFKRTLRLSDDTPLLKGDSRVKVAREHQV